MKMTKHLTVEEAKTEAAPKIKAIIEHKAQIVSLQEEAINILMKIKETGVTPWGLNDAFKVLSDLELIYGDGLTGKDCHMTIEGYWVIGKIISNQSH